MNALTLTLSDLALALSGHPRAAQTVVCLGFFQRVGGPSRFDVIVTPEGGEGQKYECSPAAYKLLKDGMTPAQLGLEPVPFDTPEEPEDDEAEYRAAATHRAWERDVTPRRL